MKGLASPERNPQDTAPLIPYKLFEKGALPAGVVLGPGKLMFQKDNLPIDAETESKIFAAARCFLTSPKDQTVTRWKKWVSTTGVNGTDEVSVTRSAGVLSASYVVAKKGAQDKPYLPRRTQYSFDEASRRLQSISVDLPSWKTVKTWKSDTAEFEYLYDVVSAQCAPISILHTLEDSSHWALKTQGKASVHPVQPVVLPAKN